MARGYTAYAANAFLNAVCNNTSLAVAQLYVKLHIGDPGAAGTGNPASNTTRMAASFGTGASGVIANDVAITWTSVPAAEDYTDFSLWDSATVGNCWWTGTTTAAAVAISNDFTVPIGDLDLTTVPAS